MSHKPATTKEYKLEETLSTINIEDSKLNEFRTNLANNLFSEINTILPEENKLYLHKFLSTNQIAFIVRQNILKYYNPCNCENDEHEPNCKLPKITKDEFIKKGLHFLKLYSPKSLGIKLDDSSWAHVTDISDLEITIENNEVFFENTMPIVHYHQEEINDYFSNLCYMLQGLGSNVSAEYLKIKDRDNSVAYVYLKCVIN